MSPESEPLSARNVFSKKVRSAFSHWLKLLELGAYPFYLRYLWSCFGERAGHRLLRLPLAVLEDVPYLCETIPGHAKREPILLWLCAPKPYFCPFRIGQPCTVPANSCSEKTSLPYSYCTPPGCPNSRCRLVFTSAEGQADDPSRIGLVKPKRRIKVLHRRSTSNADVSPLSTQRLAGENLSEMRRSVPVQLERNGPIAAPTIQVHSARRFLAMLRRFDSFVCSILTHVCSILTVL